MEAAKSCTSFLVKTVVPVRSSAISSSTTGLKAESCRPARLKPPRPALLDTNFPYPKSSNSISSVLYPSHPCKLAVLLTPLPPMHRPASIKSSQHYRGRHLFINKALRFCNELQGHMLLPSRASRNELITTTDSDPFFSSQEVQACCYYFCLRPHDRFTADPLVP